MKKLLAGGFLSNFLIASLFNAYLNGNAHSAAPSAPVDGLEAELKKIKISEVVAPSIPTPPKFEVSLERHLDDPANYGKKKIAARYFSKTATLKCHGVAMTGPEAKENFGEEAANHLKDVEDFMQVQVNLFKGAGWHNNYLTASLFAIVYDKKEDNLRRIEGSLLVEGIEREIKSGEPPSLSYDFSILPGNKGLRKDKQKVNFSSKFISKEFSENIPFSSLADGIKYLSISKEQLRPITETNNHGDQLALYTIATNIRLFFNLIDKTAHKQDLPILSMGVRYYSSYDACDTCFKKIYDTRGLISRELTSTALSQGYSIVAIAPGEARDIPFDSLFYASRPCAIPEEKGRPVKTPPASYGLSWTDPRSRMLYTHSPYHVTYRPDFSYGKPVYNPFLINFPPEYMQPFTTDSDKRISLLEGCHPMSNNYIYSYVENFKTGEENFKIGYTTL
jgi:hypothetical protein